MADKTGYFFKCSTQGCPDNCEIFTDKRGKYFTDCPTCGRNLYNRNGGQALIKNILADLQAADELAPLTDVPEPEKPPEKPENTPENEPETNQGRGGLLAVGLGLTLGLITWIHKKQKNQNAPPVMR